MTKPTKSHGRLSIAASAKPRALIQDTPEIAGVWKAKVITLFPESFPGVLGSSLTGRALTEGLWSLETIDLRQFGDGKHRNVDDTPAGGGAGMVLRADVMEAALKATFPDKPGKPGKPDKPTGDWPIVYLSPRGKPFTQSRAASLAQADGMTLICGRFEGLDERVIEHFGIEEISLGDYVLTGGEIAAQALIDATVRLIPNVLGNAASTEDESFSDGLLEHPQYTRPTEWQGRLIPDVLLSGNHGKVDDWRQEQSEKLTRQRRPDLWRAYTDQSDE
jgi:tRNA (guanine37-N1)-methyltransferase